MGESDELHQVNLPEYQIARVPITNAQYALFIQDIKYNSPPGWEENRPPKGKVSHPVVRVSWYDAMKYCEWLGEKTGKSITLPTESQWEKAARSEDKREYPWGKWENYRANTIELGVGDTTPVGIFLEGASPYGVLDMSGNVWEWTRSNYKDNFQSTSSRVLRGGSFSPLPPDARCASRGWYPPDVRYWYLGFRVVVSPVFSS